MNNYQLSSIIAGESFRRYAVGLSSIHNPLVYDLLAPEDIHPADQVVKAGLDLVLTGLVGVVHNLTPTRHASSPEAISERALEIGTHFYNEASEQDVIAKAVRLIRPNPLTDPSVVRSVLENRVVRTSTAALLGGVEPHPSLASALELFEIERVSKATINRIGSNVLRNRS